jgi:non-lysosomal glucosylceramidase
VVALSGFHYEGDRGHVIAMPRLPHDNFRCFWATGTGWGTYSLKRSQAGAVQWSLRTLSGSLPCRSCALAAPGSRASAQVAGKKLEVRLEKSKEQTTIYFAQPVELREGEELEITIAN